MNTIPRNQVVKQTRHILPREHAAMFVKNRHYLMMYANGQHSALARKRMMEATNGDKKLITKMVEIYNQLASTVALFSEKVSNAKSVTGKKSLLEHLTDGETHHNVYPDVNFN
jgi:hypothetical protein